MNKAKWANGVLLMCVLFAGADLGGSFYEGALVVPVWQANPPATLALIQPSHGGIELVRFWLPIHGIFNLLLFFSLWLCWKDLPRRKLILAALGTYIAMRIWTFAYFIPEITAFMQMPLDGPSTPELVARTQKWGWLSHGRGLLVLVSTVFLMKASLRSPRTVTP